MSEYWDQVTGLFDAARALGRAEREAFLAAACNGNAGLRAEVESLLQNDQADSFLAQPASSALAAVVRQSVALPEIGQLLSNRYRMEARMATGGQAIVYRARDEVLRRPVVIKFLRSEGRQDRFLQARLRHEMEVLARIDHPAVVGILDIGELADGSPFLVIQYIEGESLREALANAPLERDRVAAIVRQMGAALSAAHALGIAHRDLKPENIMLQRLSDGAEAVKLIDFGIAKVEKAELDAAITTVMIAGTIRYMAPEQFSGENGPASDIYALALIACEMLSGHPDLRTVPARLGSRVRRTLQSALAFRPEDRPQQVRAWSDELAAALTSHTRRNFALAAASSAALLGGGALAGSRWYAAKQETPRVIEYTAPFDPITEGFRIHNDLVGTIVENSSRTGYEAWRVTSPRQGDYYCHLTDRQKRLALKHGWTLTAIMRAEEGSAYVGVDFAGYGNRFDLNVHVLPGADLVRLYTQIVPARQGLDYTIPRTQAEYRRYELVYDPGLATATLSIDGKKVLSGYRGHSQFAEDWGIIFGATLYASPRGIGAFKLVRFEINP